MKKIAFVIVAICGIACPLSADQKVEELQNQVCTLLPIFEGWCSTEKALTLLDLVLEVKPKVCVDIGVFAGASLFPVAYGLKFIGDGVVVGIDPWDRLECVKYLNPVKDEAHIKWWSGLDMNYIYFTYVNMLKRFGLEKYCLTMRATSEKAASSIDLIDILHIDGNHDESCFTQDVELYLPKMRSGGYILLNDSLWGEAQPAIDLLMESCDVVKVIDNGNCVVFKKR